ncbi:Ig-like domain-containing protein [Limnohabitans sp. HM2-2]|uniref:Ig-like domain-containing protein n=2 Tax=Limnohabitans lacus TaxID=3045173 RepID=A0ABT6XAP0_9BURK|nr:Ig-like domain-containing protein [Limnohabitans sp. HM2-2]
MSPAPASLPGVALSAPAAADASAPASLPVPLSESASPVAPSALVLGGSSSLLLAGLGLAAMAGGGGGGGGGGQPPTDTTAPTVTVSDNAPGMASGPVAFTIGFSEVVSGFDVSKLSVSGGSLSGFVANADGKTFTVLATPDANTSGTLRLTISTTGVTDAAGHTAVAPAVAEQDYAQNVLQGTFMAGPVVTDHSLSVRVFNASGQVIGTGLIDELGHYTVALGRYSGAVVVLVVDADDARLDYIDEVSRQSVDLSGQLMVAGRVDEGTEVQTLNVNPITTVAALKAGLQVAADGVSLHAISLGAEALLQSISTANSMVAQAMGLGREQEMLTAPIVPMVNADGSSNNGANTYGKLLAVVAGMDAVNNGDTQGSLNTLKEGITAEGTLETSARSAMTAGANAAHVAIADIPALTQQAATGIAAFSGTAEEGGTLRADTGGITDPDGTQLSFSYQWQIADTANGNYSDINGATASSYAIASDQSQIGKYLRVVVTATNDGTASGTTFVSSPSAAVANVNDAATGIAAFSGTAEEGGMLRADTGGITDPDGTQLSFSYQWQMADTANGNYSDINGATASSYAIASDQSQIGKYLRVVVTATNDGTASGTTFISSPSAAVANVNDAATGIAAFSGTAEEGGTLRAETGGITDPDGTQLTFSYQWQMADTANGNYSDINGATASSYAIASDQSQIGKYLRVVVTATNDGTASGTTFISSPSAAVANVNDAATGIAAFSGTAEEGGTLRADTGGITDPDGTQLSFSYQWQMADTANGNYSDINSATASSYAIASDQSQIGKYLRVVVTATNDGTASGTTFISSPSAAVADKSPPDAVDLSANSGVQNTADVTLNALELQAGKAFLPGLQAPAASDVSEVRLVLEDNWQTQAGMDQLVLDTARSLNVDFSAQNVSLGGVGNWAYQYTASNRTLVLSQQGGGALPEDRLDDALAALRALAFKSGSASTLPRSLSVAYADTSGNVGTAATVNLMTDTRPTVALRLDSGRDGNDGVTKDPVLQVTGLLTGATWQYRTSSTGNWINGTGTAVSLVAATYTNGQVQVRQRDASGVFSTEAMMGAFTIDTSFPTNPALRFSQDTGVSSSDGFTQNGVLLVSRLETDATWEYSVNGGANWQTGSGTGWTLQAGHYLAGSVQVRQTDKAGNVSTTGKNGIDWRVDDAPSQVLSFTVNGGNAVLLKAGQTTTVRLMFDEPVAQLSADDLAVTGATVTGWVSSDGGTTWTGALSPAAMTLATGVRLTLQGAYVDLSGRIGPIAAQSSAFDVDSVALDANRGFAITGERVGDYSGAALGWSGNALFNDGLDGVLVGSPSWRSSDVAESAEGTVHGLLGRTATADLDLSALDPLDGRAWTWGEAEAALGWQAVGVGDVNGDGRQDLAFAAPYADAGVGADAGQVWVMLQAGNGTELADIPATSSGGWTVQGLAEGDALGWSVAAAGDVDGDGFDDVLVAAPYADATADALDAGQVMLVRGKADGTAGTSTVWSSPNAGDWLGFAVAGGGDINGDGLADVLLAAPDADVTVGSDTLIDAGQVYVVYGSTTGMASLADVQAGQGGRLINGFAEGQSVGHAVAVVGDVNGDGFADMVVGAPDHASSRGGAWLVWGGADDTPLDLGNPGNSGQRAVYLFNGRDDVALLGSAVAAAGDFNADGYADVLLAAPGTDGPAGAQSGAAYVVFGKATASWDASLDVTQLRLGNGSGLIYHGQAAGDGADGMALAGGGDVNGDGLSDLLVGFAAAAGTRGVTQVLLGDAVYSTATKVMGTADVDMLIGSEAAELLVGGLDSDSLVGNGGDVLLGGAGDDRFLLEPNWLTALTETGFTRLARLDGGTGFDWATLRGTGTKWDLAALQVVGSGTRLSGIEGINLSYLFDPSTDAQTVRLGVREVLALGQTNLLNSDNDWTELGALVQRHQFMVYGNAADTLKMSDAANQWVAQADITVNEEVWAVFNHSTAAAQLLVDKDVQVLWDQAVL